MAATETAVCNLALQRMGQEQIDDIDGTNVLEVKCNAIYDQTRDELLTSGPKDGWKFAKRTYHGIDRECFTITALAELVADTSTTVTATHTLVAGDRITLVDTNIDNDYDVESVSTTVSFAILADFVATDTGTAYWTSEGFGYRYAIPTSEKVISVNVGGIELTDWEQQGAYILTNMESIDVDVEIVTSVTTVTLFPDWFVKVLYLMMAKELVYNLTQDLNAIQLLEIDISNAMDKAMYKDSQGAYVKEESTALVDAGNKTDVIE